MGRESAFVKYPIGVQSFEKLRNEGYLYIDKTALVYKLVTTGSYYFLSRPRRFGKSLLVSTLDAYFRGKKELFNGLAIEKLEKDWTKHPVLHLDLNTSNYDSKEALIQKLEQALDNWQEEYGIQKDNYTCDLRFENLVMRIHKKYGERVAILIDEYDKPLLQNINRPELQDDLRAVLRSFYSVIKSRDKDICFGLLTGVSKFGKLSVFSDLNSPDDISINREWATLCGITEEEIRTQLSVGVNNMAQACDITRDEAFEMLKKKYDGYHFHPKAEGIYNPFSLLSALRKGEFGDYWFETGTPTFVVNALKKTNYNLNHLAEEEVSSDKLNGIDSVETNPVPLLYQSGYLTIKGYDERFRLYQLRFPNEEVENGFINFLLPYYTSIGKEESAFFVQRFVSEIENGDIDAFMSRLQTFYADNSYTVQGKMELYFQNTMYVIFKLLGFYVDVERTTSIGRIDMVIKTKDYIYIIEIKLDGSAEEALKQIEDRQYAAPYASDKRKLFKVGVNFASDIRGVKEWKVVE